ncbi:hypothetical protein B566_EDAN014346 [Ephemera danica]|nr:hypothetical protein B566_EDAN014346 [Ephemera danica]
MVIPEYLLHLAFNLLFLFSQEWFSLCLNIPLIAYHFYRYRSRPVMSGPGLYDPTSIMNADVLSRCQREGWVKLAFYLLSFFYYLYGSKKTTYIDKFHRALDQPPGEEICSCSNLKKKLQLLWMQNQDSFGSPSKLMLELLGHFVTNKMAGYMAHM